jgi:hypothetical protein
MPSETAHLFTSHIPAVGSGFCLLLFIFGMILHSTRILRIGLFFISITALISIWTYLSGSSAEELLRATDPSAEPVILAHKEAAATAFVMILATGVISFAGLMVRRVERTLPNWYTLMVTLLLIISLALLIGTAGIGLKITRPWLQHRTVPETPAPADTLDTEIQESEAALDPPVWILPPASTAISAVTKAFIV